MTFLKGLWTNHLNDNDNDPIDFEKKNIQFLRNSWNFNFQHIVATPHECNVMFSCVPILVS